MVFGFPDDSDSDSELSVDEHSSSYASSHSSDSEDDDIDVKPKWNNERQPVHSTPKGTQTVLNEENWSWHLGPLLTFILYNSTPLSVLLICFPQWSRWPIT